MYENQFDKKVDKALNIKTTGLIEWPRGVNLDYFRTESSSYADLDRFIEEYDWLENSHLVDFGSGKGRIIFYLNQQKDIYSTGIEVNQVNVEILNKEDLENLGTHALLAVSQGSVKDPRMIVMRYLPLGEKDPAITLVGKGVTYDSGGYAIKNARGMSTMMTDMAGAASVIGTLKAIAANNIQQNVIAIVGATENLISGEAFKNGDIINTLKGTTVEVINTDAEGRLVLADMLYYAATQLNTSCIINVATLTGAVIAALGSNITGAFTNNQILIEDVLAASKCMGEDMWQLPITDEFRDKIKGDRADLVNSFTSPAGGGSIAAAAFLEHFVEEIPWVHLDIAGTSYSRTKGNKYLPQGASGTPVKTLYQFVQNFL